MDDKDREENWVRAQFLRQTAGEKAAEGRPGLARALLAGAVALEALAKAPPKVAPPKVLTEAWGVVDEDGKLVLDEDWDVPTLHDDRDDAEAEAGVYASGHRVVRVQVVEVPS